jgi:toxin ParE1/3/4
VTIKWARDATRQLEAAHAYVANDNATAADRLLLRLVESVGRLAAYPLAGRAGRVKGRRELVILDTPYIVAYRIKSKNAIQVLAVLHGKQRWPDTF